MGKNMMIPKLKNSAFFVDKPWYGWEVGGLFPVHVSKLDSGMCVTAIFICKYRSRSSS